ncbi:NADH-quinone oxidoreductase subunit L [Pseudomonas sp.]|uniref:NADH-quinone oxidoreductase subunit L n=1 Tax=Pseudomonas sp. TaxID=306 RepID=UPI00272A737D|nr:NADH-quinone oxidoreductase subunit L [Pseudomonas sp.]
MFELFTLTLPGMSSPLLRLTLPGALILLLVVGLGSVLLRYTRRYLAGEAGVARFRLQLVGVCLAVALVLLSDHLLLLLAGWILVSATLHRLLLFYPDRPQAVLAAHKKFLLARFSDLALLGAVLLLWQAHGSFSLSQILSAYAANDLPLSAAEQWAALLIALTALLRSAQMPFHGWLIQVVEAPTPVSALLHAGVINLGGLLLILFAPLLAKAFAAQWLILLIAGPSLVLAALIMSVSASVKVRLAWSTSAQMGLMLVECALGLYELALLHMLAHSLYKAHAFLSAGEQVREQTLQGLAPAARGRFVDLAWALPLAAALVVAPAWLFTRGGEPLAPWFWLSLAVAGLLLERRSRMFSDVFMDRLSTAVVMIGAFALLKWLFETLPLVPAVEAAARFGLQDLFVMAAILTLFSAAFLLRLYPRNAISLAAARKLYAGLYIDAHFTRLTLALWPVRLPRSRPVSAGRSEPVIGLFEEKAS